MLEGGRWGVGCGGASGRGGFDGRVVRGRGRRVGGRHVEVGWRGRGEWIDVAMRWEGRGRYGDGDGDEG